MLQHMAVCCDTWQYAVTHSIVLPHTAHTDGNMLHYTGSNFLHRAEWCGTVKLRAIQESSSWSNELQHTALCFHTLHNILQLAVYRTMLQHSAHSIEFPQRESKFTLQGAMWCKTEQSVPAKLRAMHECSNCSNVLQHRLKIFHMSSIAAVKHSNARALGRFPRWSQCMSLKTGHCRLLHASTVYFNSVWYPLGMHELWHTDKAL